MNWESISIPNSAHTLLDKAGVKPFSKVQGLAAILAWFTAFPLEMRLAMIHQYLAEQVPQSRSGPVRDGAEQADV